VVGAVDVPVTLKIRTGWDREHRNALNIARIAQDSGIAALAVHGRTRDQQYTGHAEYDTIAAVKAAVQIPVFANGDIDTPQRAKYVLDYTRADAVMIGRAAQGRPWIFREIAHYLATGDLLPEPSLVEVRAILLAHLHALHVFYGEEAGVRIARKHLGWYAKQAERTAAQREGGPSHDGISSSDAFRRVVNAAHNPLEQLTLTAEHFDRLAEHRALAA
jgi:tRNA-dihydrouridine synthase B